VLEFFVKGLPMHTVATNDKKELKKIGLIKKGTVSA
jgi:hypothetical protein